MIGSFEEWMNSEYITIDERGWHISNDAPDDIKHKFDEFMKQINQTTTPEK